MNYLELPTSEKASITKVINARKRLVEAEERYKKTLESITPLIEKYRNVEGKDGEKVYYSPATTYKAIDTKRLKAERPDIAEEYARITHQKASIKCRL